MQKEVWKPVKGFENLYEVSNFGEIKALEKHIVCGKCHRSWTEHLMKTAEDHKGYLRTSLSKDGKSKTVKVHRIVAEAFLQNPDNLPQVNHIDGNKKNNAVDNLEWCSQSDNLKHACRMKLKLCGGENNSASKLTYEEVCWIRNNFDSNNNLFDSAALAEKFNVHKKTIQRIVNGKGWKGGDADVKRSKALSASN